MRLFSRSSRARDGLQRRVRDQKYDTSPLNLVVYWAMSEPYQMSGDATCSHTVLNAGEAQRRSFASWSRRSRQRFRRQPPPPRSVLIALTLLACPPRNRGTSVAGLCVAYNRRNNSSSGGFKRGQLDTAWTCSTPSQPLLFLRIFSGRVGHCTLMTECADGTKAILGRTPVTDSVCGLGLGSIEYDRVIRGPQGYFGGAVKEQ
ncbi:hypothetical protein C8R47DRAFT_1099053 [Mycena vitilis]|nr:hypothetical protein C8R47DRAFT_1099053 [Mycena vitilis]